MDLFILGAMLGALVMAAVSTFYRMREMHRIMKYVEENGLALLRISDLVDENQALTKKLQERVNSNTTDKQWMEEYKP